MKYVFLTLLVCCHYCVCSQATDSIKFKRTSIGFVFSPDYCYRVLHYEQNNKWIADLRNKQETPAFGYTTGFALKFDLTEKTSFETGLFYSVKGNKQNMWILSGNHPIVIMLQKQRRNFSLHIWSCRLALAGLSEKEN